MMYVAVSTGLFIIASLSTIIGIGKERPITRMVPIYSILMQVIFLGLYAWITDLSLFYPYMWVSILIGLVLGLIRSQGIEVYWKENQIVHKRTRKFMLIWIASIVLNQVLITYGIWYGIFLTALTTGTLIGSEGNLLYKILRVKPEPNVIAGIVQPFVESMVKLEENIVCPLCNSSINASSKYCSDCGQRIEQKEDLNQNYCKFCDSELLEGQSFCSDCGSKVI